MSTPVLLNHSPGLRHGPVTRAPSSICSWGHREKPIQKKAESRDGETRHLHTLLTPSRAQGHTSSDFSVTQMAFLFYTYENVKEMSIS